MRHEAEKLREEIKELGAHLNEGEFVLFIFGDKKDQITTMNGKGKDGAVAIANTMKSSQMFKGLVERAIDLAENWAFFYRDRPPN